MTSHSTSPDLDAGAPSPSSANQGSEALPQSGRNDDASQNGPTMTREEAGGGEPMPGFSFQGSGSTGRLAREELKQQGSPETKGPSEKKEISQPDGNRAKMMELCLSPSPGGDLQARLENVELDLGSLQSQAWQPGRGGDDSDVLLVVQRRGRPGDDTTGRRQRVFVTVVPDEMSSSTDKGNGLGGLRLRSVVNIHLGPTQTRPAKKAASDVAAVFPAGSTIAEAAKRVVSDMASVFPWSVRQMRGNGVYVYSMLPDSGALSKRQGHTIFESVMRNLLHKKIEVVYTLDEDNPPVLLLLCHQQDIQETTPRDILQQLGLPLTHSANTILALVQERGQTEGRARPKMVDFTPGLEVLLTVEPLFHQLEKTDNNGKALHEVERFSRPPYSLWKHFPIRNGISWQKM